MINLLPLLALNKKRIQIPSLVHVDESFRGGGLSSQVVYHSPTPAKPPGHSPASAGQEATRDNDIEAAANAAVEKCWSPLAGVGNCVYDILSAFTTGTVEFDSACCSAINNMAEECVASFHNQEFADTLSNYCSTH